ncbi:MAG: hypothetical protein U0271_19885 [Polyangiaceae bacterium]
MSNEDLDDSPPEASAPAEPTSAEPTSAEPTSAEPTSAEPAPAEPTPAEPAPAESAPAPAPKPAAAPAPRPAPSGAGEPAPRSGDASHERSMFFGIAASRLRSRARWAAPILVLTALLPHDYLFDQPLFLWDLFSELHAATKLGYLAVPLAALAIFVGSFVMKRGASLAMLTISGLLSAAILRKVGLDRAAWDLSMIPDPLTDRAGLAIIALACAGASANLAYRDATKRVAPIVAGAGLLAAALFYLFPAHGETPLRMFVRMLRSLPDLPDFRYQTGRFIIAMNTIWPLLMSVASLVVIRARPSKDESWFTIVTTWTPTLWFGMLITRAFGLEHASLAVGMHIMLTLALTAAVALLTAAIGVAVEAFFVPTGDELATRRKISFDDFDDDATKEKPAASAKSAGLAPARSAMAAGIAMGVLVATSFAIARPPEKALEWTLEKPTTQGDLVFGDLFETWMQHRRGWDLGTRLGSGGEQRSAMREAAKRLVSAAKEIDPKLGAAFDELTAEREDFDARGSKWNRLVRDVNAVSQKLGLPYYLDPAVYMQKEKDNERIKLHFYAYAYKIEDVRRYDVDGAPFGVLRVRFLNRGRGSHAPLGYSEDAQQFALVVLDETEQNGHEVRSAGRMGFCTDQLVKNEIVYGGIGRCGKLFGAYAEKHDEEIVDGILTGTERHELQHQIDGPRLSIAPAVLDLMEGYSPTAKDTVNREVSAFLAELTAEGVAPKLGLLQLTQYVLQTDSEKSSLYQMSSVVVFEALTGKNVRRGSRIDGDRFWEVWEELFTKDDDDLRRLAARTWEEFYGAKLPTPKLKD